MGLVDKLEEETRNLVNHITGGDSYCYMMVMADNVNWMAVHKGEHHLQNLSARVCDLDVEMADPNWFHAANTNVSVGTLFKEMCSPCLTKPLIGRYRRFNIFYAASNGTFCQELRLKHVGANTWATATRVTRNIDGQKEVLFEKIDPNFPLEADGTAGY